MAFAQYSAEEVMSLARTHVHRIIRYILDQNAEVCTDYICRIHYPHPPHSKNDYGGKVDGSKASSPQSRARRLNLVRREPTGLRSDYQETPLLE